eukprot:TRINITY_DN5704_c0_g1_i1.p1 TRINITY_DN5704_c0_g1~~TRINITY_DN5704_c0_g1_i1.p1  ORF type:complete len:190 (-),score=37.23 TRINITY_DN5704_c0_g1_i1:5-574(-)
MLSVPTTPMESSLPPPLPAALGASPNPYFANGTNCWPELNTTVYTNVQQRNLEIDDQHNPDPPTVLLSGASVEAVALPTELTGNATAHATCWPVLSSTMCTNMHLQIDDQLNLNPATALNSTAVDTMVPESTANWRVLHSTNVEHVSGIDEQPNPPTVPHDETVLDDHSPPHTRVAKRRRCSKNPPAGA